MRKNARGDLFRDEEGFTTTSMVLSLLITLALVFTAAQVYRINSASAEVQNVADAAALSAETQVAEFMVVARFCDAVVLSLSLTGIAVCGLGVVALCIPPTAELAADLLELGSRILKMRDTFSDRARVALDKLQLALPYFSAACAASVSSANNGDSAGSRYIGVGLLVPCKGKPVKADHAEKAGEFVDEAEKNADEIREKAKEAEEAAQEANEAKMRAFMRDCGDNPRYCMYERASRLAGLEGALNPLYESVDAWSFSVALARARQYYDNRRFNDEADGASPEAMARWNLRLNFYDYAFRTIASEGYVHESGDTFDANFPRLPKNTGEMRMTSLYTDDSYLITEELDPEAEQPVVDDAEQPADGSEDGQQPEEVTPATKLVMHAWDGCPGAAGDSMGHGSIASMESQDMETCPVCQFTAQSMGKVAAASSSIENGFEYHYDAVAREAEVYEDARKRAEGPKEEVKQGAGSLFEKLKEALKEAADKRIEVEPPGRYGAISFVVNIGSAPAAGPFSSGFVVSRGSLGPRVAVSGSTLLAESADEGRNVLNSMLDGLRANGGFAVGAVGFVLDLWSGVLKAYSDGIDVLGGAVSACLNSLPLASASGLGTWASDALREAISDVGLAPAKLEALKPVLVNSTHVAAKDEGPMGGNLVSIKQHVVAHPLYSTDLFSAILTDAEKAAIDQVEGLGDSVEIASIELLGDGGPTIPITIPIPAEAKQFGVATLQGFFDQLRAQHAETVEVRAWE